MSLSKRTYVDGETIITAQNLNDIQDNIISNAQSIATKGTYSKPSGGIPKSDLDSAVQASLGKADSAVQPSSLADVATSGSYDDLTDTPTIPTVNNATLTIKQGGTTKGTFSANASSNVEINLDAGSGADMPVTTNLIKGDGAGGAAAATPGTDYIKPDANGDVEITGELYLKRDNGVLFESRYYDGKPELALLGSEGDEAVRMANIETPTGDNDAANKKYVDDAIDAIPLDNYVTNTDYATSSVAGVIRTDASTYATGITSSGKLRSEARSYAQYQTLHDNAFIAKGTLEAAITGKGLATETYVDDAIAAAIGDAIGGAY